MTAGRGVAKPTGAARARAGERQRGEQLDVHATEHFSLLVREVLEKLSKGRLSSSQNRARRRFAFRGETEAHGPAISSGVSLEQAVGFEAVDQPHRSRGGQLQDLLKIARPGLVQELVQSDDRRGAGTGVVRRGLRGDAYAVCNSERYSSELVDNFGRYI